MIEKVEGKSRKWESEAMGINYLQKAREEPRINNPSCESWFGSSYCCCEKIVLTSEDWIATGEGKRKFLEEGKI